MAKSQLEALRVREARKYRPNRSPSPTNGRPRQDVALHAMIQLIVLKFNVARAMVSLIDETEQFIIAESTAASDPAGLKKPKKSSDELWLGCHGSLARPDTLCQYTMRVPEPEEGYAIFQVEDLQKEPRFQHVPSVNNPPHLTFYAGTPLISPQGLRVGTLCVLDEKSRRLLDEDEQDFLGVMAAAVMRHLDLESEMQLHSRYTKMSTGLADFVLRENACLGDRLDELEDGASLHSPVFDNEPDQPDHTYFKEPQSLMSSPAGSHTYRKVFTTAADILRHSLDADLTILAEDFADMKTWSTSHEMRLGISYSDGKRPFMDKILAHEHPEDIIRTLCQRWPLGKVWVRDDTNLFVGVDDDLLRQSALRDQRRPSIKSADSQPDAEECEWLHNWLPTARQVMFVPLWDPATTQEPSACFVMTQNNFPQFSAHVEVPFLRAFLNSLSVLCGHLTMRLAEQQKDQLLSSISHELRSPLHGIIASVEMLSATALDQKQNDLVESIDVCSQTLLDTMSLVMDHAMVNSFVEGRSKNPFTNNAGPSVHAGSSLHLESTCNLAALCEEGINITQTAFLNYLSKSDSGRISDKHHVDIDFRASRADWTFICTPGIIRRLVMNLVSNSMKYTESGWIRVELSQEYHAKTGTEDDSWRVVLSVSDTGQGMSTAFLKNGLFLPFSQESSTAPGLGLGLSIVRASVASLGGDIDVDSREGHGTTVKVEFPAIRPATTSKEASRYDAVELKPLDKSTGVTYRILEAVEATERHYETLKTYLEDWWLYKHIDDMATTTDWTFIDERDLISDLPPSNGYIVMTRSLAPKAHHRIPKQANWLRVPFGPKALAKALQMTAHNRRISSIGTITDNLKRFQLAQPNLAAPDETHMSTSFELSTPSPIARHLSSSGVVGIPSPTSPLALPSHKRPTEYFSGLQHAHSDAVVTTISSPASRGASVLCVDDNTINLRLLQTYCTKLGFSRVSTAEDGLQAVQAVKDAAVLGDPPGGAQPFDVIFMDLTMPVCDGFEATRRIRDFEADRRQLASDDTGEDADVIKNAPKPRATIIAITALASEADQKKAFGAGVDHFVTKPLRFKDLKTLLVDLGVL
jgi:signal transduction histidine kinase/CheY-like chemotaxis protein